MMPNRRVYHERPKLSSCPWLLICRDIENMFFGSSGKTYTINYYGKFNNLFNGCSTSYKLASNTGIKELHSCHIRMISHLSGYRFAPPHLNIKLGIRLLPLFFTAQSWNSFIETCVFICHFDAIIILFAAYFTRTYCF